MYSATLWILLSALVVISANPLRESRFDLKEERNTGAVKFYLYTKLNPNTPQELFLNDAQSIRNSHFHSSRQTKVIIHGWTMSYTKIPNPELRSAYMQRGDYNIIAVDWNEYAKLNYISSRAKVPLVGEDVAEFLDFLNKEFGLSYKKLVVIGHSLGAHIAGFCGKYVKAERLSAIVGLDPAFPLYTYENVDTRLNSNDASYVQTVQTNGNVKGFLKPIGSASFYPNWGRSQPGCGLDLDGGCAHARCVDYYAEAVVGYSFSPVKQCKTFDDILSYNECSTQTNTDIGDPMDIIQENGIFYVETKSSAPFGHK